MFNNSNFFNNNSSSTSKRNSLPASFPTEVIIKKKSPIVMKKLDINFKKPEEGTFQNNMSSTEIRKQLDGYKPLRTMEEKKILTTLPFFKTWVKYHGPDNKLKIGGVMIKQEYPKYIMLMNLKSKITWSVQLENNTIYIPENMLSKDSSEIDKAKMKNINTKNKLMSLYKSGRLQLKK